MLTTRVRVTDLDGLTGVAVKLARLNRLSRHHGVQLLGSLGVNGTDKDLQQAAEAFGGHALAVTPLGSLSRERYGREIRHCRRVPPLKTPIEKGGPARRVMEAFEAWFGGRKGAARRVVSRVIPWMPGSRAHSPELEVLGMLGLFNRPADGPAIEQLRRSPGVRGLTDPVAGLDEGFMGVVVRLRQLSLVAPVDLEHPDSLDTHQLVQEHFAERLKAEYVEAWRQDNGRLFDFYRSPAASIELPVTIEEKTPLYHAVAHGCEAGRYQQALDEVYQARIQRGGDVSFNTHALSAVGAELAVLSGFFKRPWSTLMPGLKEASRGYLLNEVGFGLKALGRLREAAEPMRAGLEARERQRRWRNAATAAGNLSDLHVSMGELQEQRRSAERSVELADRSKADFERLSKRAALGDVLHNLARIDES